MEIFSMDGKESRVSKRTDSNNGSIKPLHTLNLYSSGCGFCIGQEFIKEKTNKIPAGPVLLGKMDLKGNHPLFYKELQEYFSEEKLEELEKMPGNYKKTIEKEHGGIASREYYQTDEIWWYEDKKKWKGLATFGMVKKKLENILSALSADAIKAALYKVSN